MSAPRWLAIRKPITGLRGGFLKVLAFLIPLGLWCLISYCPYVWHPQMLVTDPGDSSNYAVGNRLPKQAFAEENARLTGKHLRPVAGHPANPVFLPEPLEVAKALYKAFITAPGRRGDVWLHQALLHSMYTIFVGFAIAAAVAIPLGVICGTFDLFAKLTEPFLDFVRYMPAPVFGALAMATLGLEDAPKFAIIFIGTFFNMALVVMNTTRSIDPSLLEAAQTLGTSRVGLLLHVVLPGILPGLYRDIRIFIGAAWTFLMIAELVGLMSGLSLFINQQSKYRAYDNVFAGIIIIGAIGFLCDQFLALVGSALFPWQENANHRVRRLFVWLNFLVEPIEGSHPEPPPPGFEAARNRARASEPAPNVSVGEVPSESQVPNVLH